MKQKTEQGLSEEGYVKNEFEIAPEMTVESMEALFYNSDLVKRQPERIYRVNAHNYRLYYRFLETGEPEFYVSVTTLIKKTLPTSDYLIKWIADMGYEEAQKYAAERAEYGTFMHAEITRLLIDRTYDLSKIKPRLKMFIESQQLKSDCIFWADDLKKDLLSFAQFMIEYNVVPIAIEMILYHPKDGYAGAIDLVCEMDYEEKGFFGEVYKTGEKAGQPKETKRSRRINAIIDNKSGRKGFYESCEIQLQSYREMWDHHFPEVKIDKVFNWSPKDWRGKIPTFNLKDQTDSASRAKLPYLVELARIENNKRENKILITNGVIDLTKGLSSNIEEMELNEIVKKRRDEIEAANSELGNQTDEEVLDAEVTE